MPLYRDAVYGGESVVLANSQLRMEFHKRRSGWGWGELSVPGDEDEWRFFAVLEHLGEMKLAQLHQPFRLEAETFSLEDADGTKTLTFPVSLQQNVHPKHKILAEPPVTGTVTFTLSGDDPFIDCRLDLTVHYLIHLEYLRGTWLRVGADSFGTERDDAILPGVEWAQGHEWSSGTDHFEHPWALRVAPHPHKVAIPVMAMSHGGVGLGLSWNPDQTGMTTRLRMRCPQPVFASPNFVDRRPDHLMGLMWPSARWGLNENELLAKEPLSMAKDTPLALDSRISVVRGKSLEVVLDWVRRHGFPDPGAPRYPWDEVEERVVRAYDKCLWREGEGFHAGGVHYGSKDCGRPGVPAFVRHYTEKGADAALRESLAAKVAWCDSHREERSAQQNALRFRLEHVLTHESEAVAIAEQLLERQTPEGDFPFDPDGFHATQHIEHANWWRPMGRPGESALALCVVPAAILLFAGEEAGRADLRDGGRKTLDFAMRLGDRPEGGDWWETPLHAPSLLAAGQAAIAYGLGYRIFGEDCYLARARHWIRCLIPFTHLWQPRDVPLLYNTKPCFCSSVWHLANWVTKQVQWEVLQTFLWSDRLGLDWSQLDPDPDFDWDLYHRGVATAVLRWMVDHEDPDWMYCSEFPPALTDAGQWDTLWADTFDVVENTYGGGPISPQIIVESARLVLKKISE